jgi:hypothetical protein
MRSRTFVSLAAVAATAFISSPAPAVEPALTDTKANTAAASMPASTVKPPPPPAEVPDIRKVNPPVLCVDCDRPFDTTTHKNVLEGLVNNPYVGELRKALYLQDTYHQFQSKAHFDNCDFDSAAGYITELLDEAAKAHRSSHEGQDGR